MKIKFLEKIPAKFLKPTLLIVLALVIVGTAIIGYMMIQREDNPVSVFTPAPEGWATYQNKDYGFSFSYPLSYDVNVPSTEETKSSKYMNLDGITIGTIRDLVKNKKPEPIARMYFYKGMSVDKFKKAIINFDPANNSIKDETTVLQGGLEFIKITNTTASGSDKFHYVLKKKDGLVVFSVFFGGEQAFDDIFKTISGM